MPETKQSVVIDAPADEVWQRFANFHDLSWAPNVITSVEKVGDVAGSKPGARRILNGAFHETLTEIDHTRHKLRYSIDDGPSPVSTEDVSDYVGAVHLMPEGNGTRVVWASSWKSDSDDAVTFCGDIYSALLDELQASFA